MYSVLVMVGLLFATVGSVIAHDNQDDLVPEALADQWALVGVAINEPGYDIWGSSPVRDEQGRVHVFCARWPSKYPFVRAWKRQSEIAHYVADGPEGPFDFVEVVGKGRGKGWNAVGFHNPSIKKIGDKYVLVYIANDGTPKHGPNQRIGMMIAESLGGPWKDVPNADTPILSPPDDPSIWCYKSGCGVNNPALLAHPDGRYFLYFKARQGKAVKMGVAIAVKLEGPYIIQPKPITANNRTIEDGYAFVWRNHICLLTTDNHGIIEAGGGLLWVSRDGLHFDANPLPGFHNLKSFYLHGDVPANANYRYTHNIKFERPQLLLDKNGEPQYLYCPSGIALDGSDGTNAYVLKRKVAGK